MLKAVTHFEQVPLAVVMKIMEQDKQIETSEESRQNSLPLRSTPSTDMTVTKGGEHE